MTEEKTIYEVATKQPVQGAVINFEEYAMTEQGVMKQVQVIQSIMHGVMKQDEHFGTIPGTKKPSLYKAGAEKLSLTFRLRPEYEIRRSDLPNGHREYEVVCTLYHIPTGQSVGQGVGSATTMEGKYRYRGGEKEGTGRVIPKEYWNLKGTDPKKAQSLIGGPGFSAGKIDGKWEICSIGEKQEHDNPADYYNTVLKMAKKRAHVDSILTATAASDIFTQDVEDMPEVIPGAVKSQQPEEKEKKPEASKPLPPQLQRQQTTDGDIPDYQPCEHPEFDQPSILEPEVTNLYPHQKQIESLISGSKIDRELFKEYLYSIGWLELRDEKPSLSTISEVHAKGIVDKWASSVLAKFEGWKAKQT
jgi:hypothetical protein